MALFLVELLGDALEDLAIASTVVDSDHLLQSLEAAEDADYEKFRNSLVDPGAMRESIIDLAKREGFDLASLATSPSFCHTARRPADIRYKGILTESEGESNATHFDRGTFLDDALASPNATDSSLRLVYDNNEEEPTLCSIPTNMDRRDYFFVSGTEGWKTLTVPNNAEIQAYGTGDALKGYVAVCFAWCKHEKCPAGALKFEEFVDGKFEFAVNGIKADSLTSLKQRCELLYSNSTGYLWQPNTEGRFEFGARIAGNTSATNYLRLGAIIVW